MADPTHAEPVVVVGAGMAGGRAAEFLATRGKLGGNLILLGGEQQRPYKRPTVSKELLQPTTQLDSVYLRPTDYYSSKGIELRLGCRAAALDAELHLLELTDGSTLRFSKLLIATGCRPRTLPVADAELPGVHYLRTFDDATALRRDLEQGGPLVVIGGGFVGLEVAAAARTRGIAVTVVERDTEPLQQAVGSRVGEILRGLHEARGVEFRTGVTVAALSGRERVTAVELDGGGLLPCATVVIGIGVTPEVDWLGESGIELRDGIVVDEHCATGVPDVFAAGDVARWCHPAFGDLRIEHETHAQNHALVAARNMAGVATSYADLPYVWSDQYEHQIRHTGHAKVFDDLLIEQDAGSSSVTVGYAHAGMVHAALTIDAAREFSMAQQLLAAGPTTVDAWRTGLRATR